MLCWVADQLVRNPLSSGMSSSLLGEILTHNLEAWAAYSSQYIPCAPNTSRTYIYVLNIFRCLKLVRPIIIFKLMEIKRRFSRLNDDFFFLLKVPPKCKSNFSRTEAAYCYSGPRIWNELSFSISSISELESFKTALKTYFFNLALKSD